MSDSPHPANRAGADRGVERASRGQPPEIAVFVHAAGTGAADPDWTGRVRSLGVRVLSRSELPGCERTAHGYDDLPGLLDELAALLDDRPIVLLRAGIELAPDLLEGLALALDAIDGPAVVAPLSNAHPDFNPFAGLDLPRDWDAGDARRLVELLADRSLLPSPSWPAHLLALNAAAVREIARSGKDAVDVAVAPWLFAADTRGRLTHAHRLEPHESPRPPAWADLAARISNWVSAGANPTPFGSMSSDGGTLHVSHNWGGGVAAWIDSFIDADAGTRHFRLIAEAPRSGDGCGQRLALYAGNEHRCPVDSWWLQPVIASSVEQHPQYAGILQAIRARFGISRVIVSSLIGHSLEVLQTGLPKIQVLHDHYPLWPLLSVHPVPSGLTGMVRLASLPGAQWWTRPAPRAGRAFSDPGVQGPGRSPLGLDP